MKVLFIISGSDTAFWLSEVTHPYWHLTERGVEVDFASPTGGKVVYDRYSDPYFEHSMEPDDLVSKGFLSDKALVAKLDATLKLSDVDLSDYDAFTSPADGARHSTFTQTPTSLERSNISGRRIRSSAPSATARLRWETFPIEFGAGGRPDIRSRAITSCSGCSAAASSSRTTPRRFWRRQVPSTRGLRRTILS
jgi:hypothetical protein